MEIRNGIIFFDTKAEFEAYVSDANNVSITNYPVYIGDTKEIITHNVTYKDASEIDASQITSGTISVDRLPAGSLERCVVVANESARFALTTNDVQDGDTVKQSDTGVMYMVVDVNNLNSDAGYLTYTAVTDWESIANKPEFDYVKYSEQELTDEQKQIARENIGVPTKVSELENDKNYLENGSGIIANGIYVYDTLGRFTLPENWDTSQNDLAVGVAVVHDHGAFVVAGDNFISSPELEYGIKWGGFGVDIPDLQNFETPEEAKTDFDGVNNTKKIINALGEDCAAYVATQYIFKNGKAGYLPSAGEMQLYIDCQVDVDSVLQTLNLSFPTFANEYFGGHVSTELNANECLHTEFGFNGLEGVASKDCSAWFNAGACTYTGGAYEYHLGVYPFLHVEKEDLLIKTNGDGTNLLADDGEYKAIKTVNGESLLGEGNIDVEHLIEVTYNELYDLKHNSQLIPGAKYRIMDYECMLKSESVKGVIGSYHTVVVTALTNNQLSHDGVVIPHVPKIYASDSNGYDYYDLNFSNEYIVIKSGDYEYFCKRHFMQDDSGLIINISSYGECIWASMTEEIMFSTSTMNGTVDEIVTDQNGNTYTVTVPAKTYYGWSSDYIDSIGSSASNRIVGLSLNKNITNGDTIFRIRSSDFRIESVSTVESTETPSYYWYINDYTYRIKYLFENAELIEKLNFGAEYCPNLEMTPFSRHALVHCQLDNGSEASFYFTYVPSIFYRPWWCAINVDSMEMLVLTNENEFEFDLSYNIKTGEQYLLCGMDGSYLMPIGTATVIEDSKFTFQLHKGFIYEMEDVHGNQFPYDFMNSEAYKREVAGIISPNGFLHDGCSNNKVILDTLRYAPVVVSFANGSDDNRVELGNESLNVIRIENSKGNFIKSSSGDILLDSSSYNVINNSYNIKLNGGGFNVIKYSNAIDVDAAQNCEFNYNWSIYFPNTQRITNCFFGYGANHITFNSKYVSDVSIISGVSYVVFNAVNSNNIKVETSNVTLGEDVSNNKIVGKNSANQTIIYNPADLVSDSILNSTF